MTAPPDLLVIAASSGENLKLAERFAATARARGLSVEVIDLTTLPLPLYTPRIHESEGIPEAVGSLSRRLEAAPRWLICAPEYNGSIPPVLTSAIAWLSVQGDDFRRLFNGRPIGIATHSGGHGCSVTTALRIQLAHLGAQVVGRQVTSNNSNPARDSSIDDLVARLATQQPIVL
jgi:NAD(P)H-dependent FMN reductase